MDLDPDVPFLDLDLASIGDHFVRLVITSRQLGHSSVLCTMRDYSHPGGPPEHEFIRDVFRRSPEEVAERWFGGSENCARFTSHVLTAIRARHPI